MFSPRNLLELEALLPAALPPAVRTYLSRRPQASAFPGWYCYPRALVLERYKERLAGGETPEFLPLARRRNGSELIVDIVNDTVWLDAGREKTPLSSTFEDWLKSARADRKRAIRQPLLAAARTGNLARIERLLQKGADIDHPTADGITPLMAALLAWQYEAANLLLDRGAAPDPADKDGHTALHWACYRNQAGIVKRLLDAGADIQAQAGSGEDALFFARNGPDAGKGAGAAELVELLRAYGAAPGEGEGGID